MCKGGNVDPSSAIIRTGSDRKLQRSDSFVSKLKSFESRFNARSQITQIKSDIQVLKTIWFKRIKETNDHADRLEQFYAPQSAQYDSFRSRFLWGRRPLLAACAARLEDEDSGLVWVDMGGGTGENVLMMSDFIDLNKFSHIYVVDLCSSLCKVARMKMKEKGLKNVTVVEADATQFTLPEQGMHAHLVTFSYSLSMMPNFHAAVDAAVGILDPSKGLIGVADFYTSSKYDFPLRQHSWFSRFFWRSVFDTDGIDLGPERRAYLDHVMSRVWEFNDSTTGKIPYIPILRAPFYVWLGRIPKLEYMAIENKIEAPPLFPPSFLYTQSWEDPRADEPYLRVGKGDVCLTLTSGGCNSLYLCLQGAKAIYSVDCNPAQSALLELKQVGIRRLQYEDFWKIFGEGKHPEFRELFEKRLAPFLSQTSLRFWKDRRHYFDAREGLYYHGGMGRLIAIVQVIFTLCGLAGWMSDLAHASDIQVQRSIFRRAWILQILYFLPMWMMAIVSRCASIMIFNRLTLWFGGGVPVKQYELILKDETNMAQYVARCFNGVIQHTHIAKDNYFYYNCLTGKFARDNCPDYLKKENFDVLKSGCVDSLYICNGFFLPELSKRMYSKVILMDHLDWLNDADSKQVALALAKHVIPGGRVILRSAACFPRYIKFIENVGFEVKCLQRIDTCEAAMDRVNMYASFWLAIKHKKQ